MNQIRSNSYCVDSTTHYLLKSTKCLDYTTNVEENAFIKKKQKAISLYFLSVEKFNLKGHNVWNGYLHDIIQESLLFEQRGINEGPSWFRHLILFIFGLM